MNNQGKMVVALAKCPEYVATDVGDTIRGLFETINFRPARGMKVLVKPNLLTPRPPDHITCTHPLVVRAVCEYLLDAGCQVRVGDSPTFGKAVDIAESIGLTQDTWPICPLLLSIWISQNWCGSPLAAQCLCRAWRSRTT